MNEPGYEKLAAVLQLAYDQAARGKGKERHANGEPFHEQVMQTGAQRFGVGALLFQAFKKSEESQRLPHDRAVAELLGSIVYLAGAVIALEQARSPVLGPELEWHGGPCPVATSQKVLIKSRRDALWSSLPVLAGLFEWSHSVVPDEADIVAYRLAD